MHNIQLYQYLTAYGDVYQTSFCLTSPSQFIKWTEESFSYVKYNPRKDIARYGLSITSLDGGLSGIPDLDSLREYSKENNLNLQEADFSVTTPIYNYPELTKILNPIKHMLGRSHILKLGSGGFFPVHRDLARGNFNSFRILVPLKNMNPPNLTFVLEGKIINWDHGYFYFVNTAKEHYLFNSGFDPAYLIVLNLITSKESVDFVIKNLKYR